MKAYFFIFLHQCFLGTWYEKPPAKSVLSGSVIFRPCAAPKYAQSKIIAIGDTVFITDVGWARIEEIEINAKFCKFF